MNQSRRNRRNQRLMIIGSVLAVLVFALVGWWLYVRGQTDQAQGDLRAEGLSAFQSEAYDVALARLEPYVERNRNDAEALYALARARAKVPHPQNQQIPLSAQYLRQTIAADPTMLDAAHDLLALYLLRPTGLESEILNLSEQILEQSPQDEEGLRGKAIALQLIGRNNEALQAVELFLKVKPGDVGMHRLALEAMRAMNQPMSAIFARVEALRNAYPEDPTFEYLQAYVYFLDRNRPEARRWLDEAVKRPPPDGAFTAQLLRLMDAARMFPQALAYLEKNVGPDSDVGLKLELARRQFEWGNLEAAHTTLETIDDEEASAAIALDVVALSELGRAEEAGQALDRLASLGFPAAKPWADFLRLVYAPGGGPQDVIEAGAPLRELGVRDPYTSFLIGRAQEQTGDYDTADASYKAAAELRPSWASPRAGMARLAMREGDKQAAAGYAIAAALRRPDDVETQVLSLVALGMDSANLEPERIEQLDQLIDQVQVAVPGEPRTLLLRVKLLAELKRSDDARAAARSLLNTQPVQRAPVLLNLASLSRQYNLGLDQETYDLIAQAHGQSPDIALSRALELAQTEKPAEALVLFDQLANGANSLEWQIARVRLLDRLDRPEAAAARWVQLTDANPKDLDLQRAALASRTVWRDRDVVKKIIERVRDQSVTGDERWRIEMARYLLTGDDRAATAGEADAMIETFLRNNPPSGQVLMLQGMAKLLLDQPQLAVQSLQRAVSLEPTNPRIRLELARAFAISGSRDRAAEQTRQALGMEGLDADETRFAVQLLMSQGQASEAIAPMEALFQRGQASRQDLYGLAELYLQSGQAEKARSVLPRLLENPDQTAVLAAANLYGRLGEKEQSLRTLDLLNDMGLPAEDLQTLRGAHLARFGEPRKALDAFVAATEAAPRDGKTWRNLVEIRLRMNDLPEAIAAARRGMQVAPDDEALRAIVDNAERIERLGGDSGLLPLITSLVTDPQNRAAAVQALTLIDQAKRQNLPGADLAKRLTDLAGRYPRSESVRLLAITATYQTGSSESAVQQAAAAARDFPDSAAAARLSAETLLDTQQWSKGLLAAEQWRDRDPVNQAQADTLIAKAQGQLGRPDRGIQTLTPYRPIILSDPERYPQLVQTYARLNAQGGQVGAARDVLDPLLTQAAAWRMMALDVATNFVTDTALAESWVQTISQAIPVDSSGERTALAHGWWTLAKRTGRQSYVATAVSILDALKQISATDTGVYFLRGMIAESQNDWPAAEDAYRAVIQNDRGSAGARNNLAMVLTQTDPPKLEEAIGLAEDATRMSPDEPNFYDTLALVQLRAGRPDAAADTIRQAIELEPTNPQWRVRLNEINQQRGNP